MIIEYGDMWDQWGNTDLFVITTNAYICNDGKLAMGRGMARDAKINLPSIDFRLGCTIKCRLDCGITYSGVTGDYNFVTLLQDGQEVAAFQVKRHFKDNADIPLIRKACQGLCEWIAQHPKPVRVDMNFPGIGYGGLSEAEVFRAIGHVLPDSVHVWKKG